MPSAFNNLLSQGREAKAERLEAEEGLAAFAIAPLWLPGPSLALRACVLGSAWLWQLAQCWLKSRAPRALGSFRSRLTAPSLGMRRGSDSVPSGCVSRRLL